MSGKLPIHNTCFVVDKSMLTPKSLSQHICTGLRGLGCEDSSCIRVLPDAADVCISVVGI